VRKSEQVDVVIIGAGLAGLTLARQLMMTCNKTVLHLEKRREIPPRKQKVGESSVQVAGYYYGKVLDLEEYLFHEQLMKYNLRFLWKTPGLENDDYAHYSQGYLRNFSNIPCYQLDRNKLEADLIEMNQEQHAYRLRTGVSRLEVALGEEEPHRVQFECDGDTCQVAATWVVDTTGRKRFLARNLELTRESVLSHGSSFFWVDGTINIEKLTRATMKERLRHASKRQLGHLPMWLATNHFMGEGFWFWVIPLQGRTSFGLVYDQDLIDPSEVSTREKMVAWLFKEFPLFRSELEDKEVIDFSTLRSYSHDTATTISKGRWACSGESGRFSDPLYSPGSDLIAFHNTLIVEAITCADSTELERNIPYFETLLKIVYRSFLPSYKEGYAALGDHECFYMKYTWELTIYFVYFVFPFINHLFTDRRFLIPFFRRFAALGDMNRAVQVYIRDYYNWKKQHPDLVARPLFTEFSDVAGLARSQETFYRVDLTPKQAIAEIERQFESLQEMARYFMAHMDAVVLDCPDLVHNHAYVTQIDPTTRCFDPQEMGRTAQGEAVWEWSFDPALLAGMFGVEKELAELVPERRNR